MQPQHPVSKALSRLKLQFVRHKLLLFTLIGSILLHTVFFSGLSISLPQIVEDLQTLDMHLVQKQAVQDNIQALDNNNEAVNDHKAPKNESVAAREATPESTELADSTEDVSVIRSANIDQSPNISQSANVDPSGTELANTIEDISETVENNSTQTEPEKTVYSHVETEFEVMRGVNTSAAGVTKIIFNIDENKRYSIISTTEAKGLVSLFFGDLIQKSEGNVTENGLKPDFYSYQYGNDEKKSQTANFNWSNGVLHMHTYKGDSTANLVAGTQDFLSFMYQFMFAPALETMQITMTNGKRLRTYTYSYEGEETISTKLGELKTIHLLKGSSDEDKTEIWLAVDYQYLPVKIRKTEKDGTVIEQIVASIRTELPK
jgi:hypothetical protein